MEQSPFSEAKSHTSCQKIPRLLWNPKVHYNVQTARHWTLSCAKCIKSTIFHPISPKIHSNIILPCMPRSSDWYFPLRFSNQNTVYTFLTSLMRAVCPAYSILLDFIIGTTFGEAHKLLISSLCSLLQSPSTSSLLGPNILFSTLFSNTFALFSLSRDRQSFTPIQNSR